MESKIYQITGQVQGVGFRYTASQLARQLGIKGQVANMADGSVQLVVQASPDLIDELLTSLKAPKHNTAINIDQIDLVATKNMPVFKDFSIYRP
ncbi:hypothetical protein AWM75_06675 [Aerococcus urinaehominis]|uniref:acylphosphatase n=1 Tax=Aerococcus urinaehominis TaxID=128944 RepID=A0A109RH67_9LACT|nr:acylphosphatase [Aerococcus urinaehominis]AMB99684.1 hypothetical protein AWM75_06675 [Aerococcus urinaehominis]SDL90399.1 acylphosphatase [Aerococcus urinaehominis]